MKRGNDKVPCSFFMRLPGCLNCWIFILSVVSLAYFLIILCIISGSFVTPLAGDRTLGLRGISRIYPKATHKSLRINRPKVNESRKDSVYTYARATKSVPAEPTALQLPTTVAADACNWRCNAHVFYYMWYRSEDHDGAWAHWNHSRLPHWNSETAKKYPQEAHVAENDDIGASYWPQLGPYSSLDKDIIASHMAMMRRAGLGVVAVSWYPPGLHDPAGRNDPFDPVADLLLDAAWAHGMRVAIHLEPYEGRDPVSVRKDFQYIHEHYGHHPALYKAPSAHGGAALPLVYIYDSYHNTPDEWSRLLSPTGDISVRGQKDLDCTAIFLWVEARHSAYAKAGFDGFYTYFAASGFVYGSTPSNWPSMNKVAREAGIYFIPSVGPGYNDEEVRPWNNDNTRERREGDYYDEMFTEAAKMQPRMISITSFNEWHEGTNIEPVVDGMSSKASQRWPSRDYLSYGPDPDFYLKQTRGWIERMFKPHGAVIV